LTRKHPFPKRRRAGAKERGGKSQRIYFLPIPEAKQEGGYTRKELRPRTWGGIYSVFAHDEEEGGRKKLTP